MTSQTSDPVQRDPALWTLDSPLKLAGVPFGTRTTLIRIASGRLVIHSPGPLASGSRESIEKLGEVAAIIAPNLFHHFYVEENAGALGLRLSAEEIAAVDAAFPTPDRDVPLTIR